MTKQRVGKRGVHFYGGRHNSRGKRHISKLHKGLKSGNIEKAFKEMEMLYE
jgi:hypothetical protein